MSGLLYDIRVLRVLQTFAIGVVIDVVEGVWF